MRDGKGGSVLAERRRATSTHHILKTSEEHCDVWHEIIHCQLMTTVSREQEDYKPSRSRPSLARVRVLRDVELVLLVELVEVFVGALASRRASLAPRRRFALRRRASRARASSRPG